MSRYCIIVCSFIYFIHQTFKWGGWLFLLLW